MTFDKHHAGIMADILTDEQRDYLKRFGNPLKPNELVYHLAPAELLKELVRLEMLKYSKKHETYVLTSAGRKVVAALNP